MTLDEVEDLLIDRGICCEDQRIDFGDIKQIFGWAHRDTVFVLRQLTPATSLTAS